MIKEIISEVERAIDVSFARLYEKDYLSLILLLGRADVIQGSRNFNHTDYVIDYQLDRYYDETREGFYIHYLNRNYQKEGFRYEGVEGLDDLSIEMMIYTHLWDSSYFLKSLVRIAAILSGKGYLWNPQIHGKEKWRYMQKHIIQPLKENHSPLGDIVEKSYSTDIRNSFAHALYSINANNRTIMLRPQRGFRTISFEEFQTKFLYSVILMNKMQNMLEMNHDELGRKNAVLTKPFLTPDGIKIQVKGELCRRGDIDVPEFRMVRILK